MPEEKGGSKKEISLRREATRKKTDDNLADRGLIAMQEDNRGCKEIISDDILSRLASYLFYAKNII